MDDREIWDRKAAFWDELHGQEGNRFHRRLVSPAVERLLALRPGERVLDVACGTGVMARRLAALGGRVTAVDFSPALIERAQRRSATADAEARGAISYQVVDATDEEALVSLGAGRFDAVVSTMALMDMPAIAPLYRAVTRLLQPEGRFVFATSHPAFNSSGPVFVAELEDNQGELVTTHSLKISQYIEPTTKPAVGAQNEPLPHNYYHRPLHLLLGEAFAAGLVLDALEEPTFAAQDVENAPALSWYSVRPIPPVIVGRFRRRL